MTANSSQSIGPRLAGEDLDRVPEGPQLPGQVAGVDALSPTARVAPVDEERDAQPAGGRRGGRDSRGDLDVAAALPGLDDLAPLLARRLRHAKVRPAES